MASDETNKKRITFFEMLFGDQKGWLCLAAKKPGTVDMQTKYVKWPDNKHTVVTVIEQWELSYNVYFCTSLLDAQIRKKNNCNPGTFIWADLDHCPPDKLDVTPSLVLESSPGRYQGFWRLKEPYHAVELEDMSRRLAYKFAEYGCDTSGWDLTQLMRVPATFNHKYTTHQSMGPEVQFVVANTLEYTKEDFAHYPEVKGFDYTDVEFDPEQVPEETGEEILARVKLRIKPRAIRLFQEEPSVTEDWSECLYNLIMLCFEVGLDRYEIFRVCLDAACNKFKRDGHKDVVLWRDVVRIEQKATGELATYGGDWTLTTGQKTLLTPDEMSEAKDYKTFIEDYCKWGDSVSDAAPQYHIAGAFSILSGLLSGALTIPTSFGKVRPNLWFMILADTTLTRKSTAMDMSVDLLCAVNSDAMMATDGSLEGIMAAISARPNMPSLFYRDEFSGLVEMMNKRDYYAGMMEAFTKLYDGRNQKRILRRETIELVDPILVILAGGIKDRILGQLNHEFVSSGFIPRFIFTIAESDINRFRPLGPPTITSLDGRDKMVARLKEAYTHYTSKQIIDIGGVSMETEKNWEVSLTPEAWALYARMENKLMELALVTSQADLVTPMYARLCMSCLKASALIAALDSAEDRIVVGTKHLLKAFSYAEQWRLDADHVINNLGRHSSEVTLDRILRMATDKPGISRSEIMNRLKLSSKDAFSYLDTLEMRGLISIIRKGKNWAIQSNLKI